MHFTAEDLTKIRIRPDPHPLWEVLLSLHLVQTRHDRLLFGPWRHGARNALRPAEEILTTLAPPTGYSPDFLTPPTDSPDIEDGLEAMLSTGNQALRADMTRLAAQRRLPAWANRLGGGDTGMLRRVTERIRRYHAEALQPYEQVLRAHIRADWARRTELAATSGLGQVLSTLHPSIRWRAPVLEAGYPVEQELHLDGRGLVLVPSFFCRRTSMTFADPDLPPLLVYPVDPIPGWMAERQDTSCASQSSARHARSLATLLGRTRATILRTIADTPYLNTTELARAAGTSVAGASQHAAVLREAGLVTTRRCHGHAVHAVSDRGAMLLDRPPGTADRPPGAERHHGPSAVRRTAEGPRHHRPQAE